MNLDKKTWSWKKRIACYTVWCFIIALVGIFVIAPNIGTGKTPEEKKQLLRDNNFRLVEGVVSNGFFGKTTYINDINGFMRTAKTLGIRNIYYDTSIFSAQNLILSFLSDGTVYRCEW